MPPARHAAFLSYAHRYQDWVRVLHKNLERSLGPEWTVFLDQVDLGSGRSWVGQLQAGLDQAERMILVVTPEAMASPRVSDEWEGFVAVRRDWKQGNLHVVLLVETPLPPFLQPVQQVDLRAHDEGKYRSGLRELLGGLLGQHDRRSLPELPAGIEIPAPPHPGLPEALRSKLVLWLASVLGKRKTNRRAVEAGLRLDLNMLEGYPSSASAASAALVKATGDDDPVQAAIRIMDVLREELGEDEPGRMAELQELRDSAESLRRISPDQGLVRVYLDSVARDHSTLVRYFQQSQGFDLLDRIYVRLELRPERHSSSSRQPAEVFLADALDLQDLLNLDPAEHPWITRRWVVRGDPGAGKTTLLRHLAASLAKQPSPPWIPVFESLPRLMREREWFLDRIARRLERAGQRVEGLPAVLDRAGQEGKLLLLLDGLDEAPREDREDAEKFLRDLSVRWPSASLVVTTRPIGYRRPGSEFVELELLPLDAERRSEFLARWFGRSTGEPDFERAAREVPILESPGLQDLAGNPLYLTLMALLLEQGNSPDRNRTRLYDQVFELLLEGRHRPGGKPIEAKDNVRGILRHLGHAMTRANRDAEPVGTIEARLYKKEADSLREPLERVPRWRHSMRGFLDDLAESTGILGPHDGPGGDWRFWHRTFREELAAEELEQRTRSQGLDAVLAHAHEIAGDESRWAEPYALLTGRVDDPDRLVQALIEANRALGLRALATAQGVQDQTLLHALNLSEDWEVRARVYQSLPELIGDPERALSLLDRLRRRTRNGNDLYFLASAVQLVGQRWPEYERQASDLRAHLFNHIPAPPQGLFSSLQVPRGRVPLWRKIPEGRFRMGSPEGEGNENESPRHEVTIARPFWISAAHITNAQYSAFDPGHELFWEQDISPEEWPHHPVVSVSWFAAVSFCRWLASSAQWALGARLPLEEEWEYACRAGTETLYWSGDLERDLDRVGWYDRNSDGRTHRVGEKPANGWGLYDVHGNAWTWTISVPAPFEGREAGVAIDPSSVVVEEPGPEMVRVERVVRGSCFWYGPDWARSAFRVSRNVWLETNTRGFRVVLPGPLEPPRL
jgi:formylglycine-generating enzyme required for sulfatase activity